MLKRLSRVAAIGLLATEVLSAGDLMADDNEKRKRRDHEVAREALVSGEIRPLEAIIAEVRRSAPGDIVGIELEKYSGIWVYKIKIITPSGSMQRVNIDARVSSTPPAVPGPPTAASPGTSLPAQPEPRSR